MRKFFYLSCVLLISFTACQKEVDETDPTSGTSDNNDDNDNDNNDSTSSITGTYTYLFSDVKTQSTTEVSIAGTESKAVSFFDYITTNNKGTLVIDATTMTSKGLSYTASSTLIAYSYDNGVLVDSVKMPFTVDVPESSSSVTYELYTDSVYFPQGGFISLADGSTMTSPPSGSKIKFSGDTLRFYQTIYQDSTSNISGATYHITQAGSAVIAYKKQ